MITLADANPSARDLLRDPVAFLAFGFGSGLAPWVPGTVGTLAAVPIYWLAATYLPLTGYLVMVAVALVLGVYLCHHTAYKLGVHDHGGIVWDEFVGFWLTMIAVPLHWYWVLAGFVLFRVFDMIKPWPISVIDRRVGGGVGIMLDDVLAAIPAAACLQALIYFSG
ncbi:phosphatidylglycerophosphatase A [Saccharophagus sp. K07]|jgi:phosphatidylglycerophosphatase A|uniref:phosphatidylglycerophosphatase A family protein n=1 Tax=Saccharophagus sp. K07 TaxID=2283636 RepID=UPI001652183B|nr:phosphatidylglycerophosphatase A [Saccharophagus sp. K07]MBC6904029.1 phosphatidylglycerophosphatase A [Saccharophagus sp. K07]